MPPADLIIERARRVEVNDIDERDTRQTEITGRVASRKDS
jgi:hypothetical protein